MDSSGQGGWAAPPELVALGSTGCAAVKFVSLSSADRVGSATLSGCPGWLSATHGLNVGLTWTQC
jgi:hypothetical protein